MASTENVEFLKSMGFSEELSTEAVRVTTTLESAIEWCLRDQNAGTVGSASSNTGLEQGESTAVGDENKVGGHNKDAVEEASQQAKSLKCEDCGKLFSDINSAEFHAAKTQHSNFSESTEEKKPMTEEERAAKVAEMQTKLKVRRTQREEEEQKDVLNKEKTRRKEGQALASLKGQRKDEQMRKDVADRKKEQQEDKLHRQKLLDDIKRDRLERQNKTIVGDSKSENNSATTSAPAQAIAPVVDYDKCLLQIRLTNGESLQQEFNCSESLAAVRLYIEINRTDGSGNFRIVNTSTFPRKMYTDDDMDTPLKQLKLAPRSVLAVSKVSTPTEEANGP